MKISPVQHKITVILVFQQ